MKFETKSNKHRQSCMMQLRCTICLNATRAMPNHVLNHRRVCWVCQSKLANWLSLGLTVPREYCGVRRDGTNEVSYGRECLECCKFDCSQTLVVVRSRTFPFSTITPSITHASVFCRCSLHSPRTKGEPPNKWGHATSLFLVLCRPSYAWQCGETCVN